MFRHHPDGKIYIGAVSFDLREFLIYEPAYTLPSGMIGRKYVPGVSHTLYDGTSQYAGPLPWPEGDACLANVTTYSQTHAASWYLPTSGIPQASIPDGAFTLVAAQPTAEHVWDTGAWRVKTVAELGTEKDAKALELQQAKDAFAACLEVVFAFVKNPALYSTAGQLKLAAIAAYRAKL